MQVLRPITEVLSREICEVVLRSVGDAGHQEWHPLSEGVPSGTAIDGVPSGQGRNQVGREFDETLETKGHA